MDDIVIFVLGFIWGAAFTGVIAMRALEKDSKRMLKMINELKARRRKQDGD